MRIAYLDGPRLRRSLLAACEFVRRHRGDLNRINVFPVPDGDTGTNLTLTLEAIALRLERRRDREVHAVAREVAEAAVLGARGNAGMMLSYFLLGFAEACRDRARITARDFAEALRTGVERLQGALERPVEGTILTVMRDTARAAMEARVQDFHQLMDELVERARASLERTPELLPTLKKAGVVDAGAKGFVHLLEGVRHYIRGNVSAEGGVEPGSAAVLVDPAPYPSPLWPRPAEHGKGEGFRFCTEALVRGPNLPSREEVQDHLRTKGDSLLVVRWGDLLKVHLHTDEPEEVFAHLRTLGQLVAHKAEDMTVQEALARQAAEQGRPAVRRPVAVVTDSAADLPLEVVQAHGIRVVPLLLVQGGVARRDGVDISAQEFHRALGAGGDLPTTSQPPPAAFLEAYRAAAEEAEAVVAVLLGSNLSGTFRSAEAAAGLFRKERGVGGEAGDGAPGSAGKIPIHLVDTLGASLLQGLLVLKAAELAEGGMPAREIAEELRRIRARSGMLLTLESLDRLAASGRVGVVQARLARILGIRPILKITASSPPVVAVGKAWGRRARWAAFLKALGREIPPGARRLRFGIVHVGWPDIVPRLSEALRRRYGEVEILEAPATPVLATHVGSGTFAVAYLVED